jgi:aspartate/methionine/tyrosine aminotransferase
MTNQALIPFGTTIFSEMTAAALEHDAINLSQGFPDFMGPAGIMEAAQKALAAGHNQYARSMGHPDLVEAVAEHVEENYGVKVNPYEEVCTFSGATEGIAAFLLGFLNPGDEVVLFAPFYDSYQAIAALAGAKVKTYFLQAPDFSLDLDVLESLISDKTKLILLNTPHNPTGKVFTVDEMMGIRALVLKYQLNVLSDEVYEHLTYDDAKHVPFCTLPDMWDVTFTLSSTGKTFSFTGWKIGWGYGPSHLAKAGLRAHQFLTFCCATPLQVAMAHALRNYKKEYLLELRNEYSQRREILDDGLRKAGFKTYLPQGTYFLLADFSAHSNLTDREFAHQLAKEARVAAVPPSVFYPEDSRTPTNLLRFAFCKQIPTLKEAVRRLVDWSEKPGKLTQ